MPNLERKDIVAALSKLGIEHYFSHREQINSVNTLAKGVLKFSPLAHQLSVHIAALEEQENATSTALINPTIAVTILFKGTLSFAVGDHKYHVCSTDLPVIFVNMISEPMVFTRFMTEGEQVEKVTVDFGFEWLKGKLSETVFNEVMSNPLMTSNHVSILQSDPQLVSCAEKLLALSKNEKCEFTQIHQERLILTMVPVILTQLKAKSGKVINTLTPQHHAPMTQEALSNKLLSLLNNDATLDEIACHLGMSVSTLQRYFKSRFHTTVKQYIKQQRLIEAKKAIVIGEKTIGEAAYLAGYNHVSNFTIAFKKAFGKTPKQFLKHHRG